MKNKVILSLLSALIIQSEAAYSSESTEKQNHVVDQQGLNGIQQLKNFHQYANQRQKEMREEAEILRPILERSRKPILKEISALEIQKEHISLQKEQEYRQVSAVHKRAYVTLIDQKIGEFFQKFISTGSIDESMFYELVRSCVLVAKVMTESLHHQYLKHENEKEQALISPNVKIALLGISLSKLENYELFNAHSPVSQLRTQFLIINEQFENVMNNIPRKVLVAAELQEVKMTKAAAKVKADDFQTVITVKANELQKSCLEFNFTNVQLLTFGMQETTGELEKVMSQQQELEQKEAELDGQLAVLTSTNGQIEVSECFEASLGEIKDCAKVLEQLSASKIKTSKLQYNILGLQDQEFITNVITFLDTPFLFRQK